jgi:hypothetical protein
MAMRDQILSWLRRRRERARRIEADAEMLLCELGPEAYAEGRLMQRRAKSIEERRHWRDVALVVARKNGKRVGLDTATRMSLDADLSRHGEPQSPGLEPQKVDPIEELERRIRRDLA